MKVTLSGTKNITVREQETISTDTLTIRRIVDLPDQRIVRVFVAELPRPVIVMEGDGYREWTKADIAALLKEQV